MSRMPTPPDVLYDWHRRAMLGERLPVYESEPQCGWYVRSFSDRGLLYPAMIYMLQDVDEGTGELVSDERLRCVVAQPGDTWPSVAGRDVDPFEEWTFLAKRPVSQEEHTELVRQLLFAPKYLGPVRPYVRWFDPREIAADFFRYQGAMRNEAV